MKTLVHVGYHKTGTTTLQQEYFPSLADCVVLGPNNPHSDELRLLIDSLCFADDPEYSEPALRAFLDRWRGDAGTLVLTHEDLSHFRAGGRTAERLHSVLPDASVLVCIREQRSMLAARYGQYVKERGTYAFARYVQRFDDEFLHYDLTVDDFQRRFGADRVKVVPFELLVRDQARFFAEVGELVGAEATGEASEVPRINQTLAPPMRTVVRLCNRLFLESDENRRPPIRLASGPRLVHKLQKLDPKLFPKMERRLGRRDRARIERIGESYRESNARLERMTGLSLREFGYVVAGGRG